MALSYTWGAPTPTHKICINATQHEVPENLFNFLQAYLTYSWRDSIATRGFTNYGYWIDQICINQSNIDERNAQVGIMNKIYKLALRVLVWLGSHPDMVEAARVVRDHGLDEEDSLQVRSALSMLLQHPYFSRVWVVQEVALAASIDVFCGPIVVEWRKIQKILGRIPVMLTSSLCCSEFSIPALELVRHSQGESHTLVSCIDRYSRNQCQDARDKVYGLLGLTSERWRVHVDYNKTVLQVFLDALTAVCEELFDSLDPRCCYRDSDKRDQSVYKEALLSLGRSMGLPERQIRGLSPFIDNLLAVYLNTRTMNIKYTYTGIVVDGEASSTSANTTPKASSTRGPNALSKKPKRPLRARKCDDCAECTCQPCQGDAQSFFASWVTMSATRMRPFVRDVVPSMGLQLAPTSVGANSASEQPSETEPVRDRWWFEDERGAHHFECPSESEWLVMQREEGS